MLLCVTRERACPYIQLVTSKNHIARIFDPCRDLPSLRASALIVCSLTLPRCHWQWGVRRRFPPLEWFDIDCMLGYVARSLTVRAAIISGSPLPS